MFLNIVCACEEDSKWRKTKTNTPEKSLPVVCAREQQPVRGQREGTWSRACWIYNIYVFLALALLSLLPACLPVPAYLQYVRKLFQWKRHIFPLSLLPPPPKRTNENKTDVSRPPAKPDFDPYSYDTTTVISKRFWMKSYTMMQHEIVPKLLKTFL